MQLIIKEVVAKAILSRSGIPVADYCINPYTGCSHACRYCYASFMKKYTGHTEPWGDFVDIKINAPEVLQKQLKKASKGRVIISSVTDAYQPAEAKYKITRQCLERLLPYQFPVDILTKSPLVLRDIDLIKKFDNIEVGVTITTNDERIRKIFEPKAPAIEARIHALKTLHENRIKTYVFIGPALPMDPEALGKKLFPHVDHVYIDRMNYPSRTLNIYYQMKLQQWLDRDFTERIVDRLKDCFNKKDVSIC
ncbi:MAG: radical SAM protein [Nitrospira bacterium HGW-Nitrospira-1]|nr:MAG: radical SAM protein [Nitrospira bacterium HGW-Nitrospira-1]